MMKPPEPPFFGVLKKIPCKSKKTSYDSRLSLKERGRLLLLKEDEIDERTLTKPEREVLTENHKVSTAYLNHWPCRKPAT